MGGKSETTQQTSQQSQLTPWAPASGQIQGILAGLDPSIGNLSGTPAVSSAYSALLANASNPNPLGPLAMGAATSLLGGGQNFGAASNILNASYNRATSQLSPYTSGSALDPSSNPALARQLATVRQDVTSSVNPMFAAAGRLGSPDNYQALARGIAQGEAPVLQNAASNQLNAINMANGAAGGTASGLIGADTANAGILGQGIGNAATAYGAQNLAPQALLSAALGQQNLPIATAQQLMGILGPIAGQFGTQTGNSSSEGTSTLSPAQQAWGMDELARQFGQSLQVRGDSFMGWLDSLFGTHEFDPHSHSGGGSGWLGPIARGPSDAGFGRGADPQKPLMAPLGGIGNGISNGIAGLFGQSGATPAPDLFDRLTAGATNLTTGGNPLAGLLNAVNGLATGQRTDRAGVELGKQHATMRALMNAGLDVDTARAAAINPEFLKALVVARYGVSADARPGRCAFAPGHSGEPKGARSDR